MKMSQFSFLELPSAPLNLIRIKSTNTSITIRWSKPEKNGDNYIGHYWIEKDNPTIRRNGFKHIVAKNLTIYEHTLHNLKPDTKYDVYVSAYTKVGLGPEATKSFGTDPSPG